MFVLIGYVVLMASIFGGFAAAGGHLAALFQPLELLMIGGAAVGAFLVSNTGNSMKATTGSFGKLFKGAAYNKKFYLELMLFLYAILSKIRAEGMISIEKDVDNPEESELFKKFPLILKDHHVVEFVSDYLRLMISGNMDPFQVENLMDNELETHHHEALVPAHAIAKVADGLPAFGIVAAVMGVVHTMESVGIPPAELGLLIAHALVGTFLGILLAYGFVGPLSTLLEGKIEEDAKVYQCIKVTLLASLNGYPPTIAVEFGRKVLYSTERPSFADLETEIKASKSR